jgi:hypothetical protein
MRHSCRWGAYLLLHVDSGNPRWRDALSVQQFDPSLGTLTTIEFLLGPFTNGCPNCYGAPPQEILNSGTGATTFQFSETITQTLSASGLFWNIRADRDAPGNTQP